MSNLNIMTMITITMEDLQLTISAAAMNALIIHHTGGVIMTTGGTLTMSISQ